MTDQQVKDGFGEVYNDFWIRYRNRQPDEKSPEWERMSTRAAVLKRKYPFMEELINRLMTEMRERAMGRGNRPDDFHRPPT